MNHRAARAMLILHRSAYLLSIAVLCTLVVAACATTPAPVSAPPVRADWPTQDWQTAPPNSYGLDADRLSSLRQKIERDLPFMHSLLIVKGGRLVYEQYFAGYDRSSLNDLMSVTKSFTSALAGTAQASGKLRSPDVTLASAAPSYFKNNSHPDKRGITLRNLLMMRSGINFDDATLPAWTQEGRQTFLQQDIVEFALSQPVAHKPGQAWNYSTADTQLAAAILEGVTGMPLQQYASENLFAPLGISRFEWSSDKAGHNVGGGLLRLTARDMAKFGYLYLNHGNWDGKQIVPANWVQLTTSPQGSAYVPSNDLTAAVDWYGYGWWTWKPEYFSGHRAISAEGYGGQLITLIPDLDMIVVTTADSFVPGEKAGTQESNTFDLIRSQVMAAAAVQGGTASGQADVFWTVPATKSDLPHAALYVVGFDGKGQKLLLQDATYAFWGPAWSPDGTKIVFSRLKPFLQAPGSTPVELYIANADGTNVRQLTSNGRNNYLTAWSPDGQRVAYLSQRGDNIDSTEVYSIGAGGSGEIHLTNNDAQEYGLSWSPDGKQIVFGSNRSGEMQIYTMNADGSNQAPLPTPALGVAPSWSPDGRQIVFQSDRTGDTDIYVMDRDGSNQRDLTNNKALDILPMWSPDGKRIAFDSDRSGKLAVFVMATDGSGPVNVSGKGLQAGLSSWSPDGARLVFQATP